MTKLYGGAGGPGGPGGMPDMSGMGGGMPGGMGGGAPGGGHDDGPTVEGNFQPCIPLVITQADCFTEVD